VEGPDTTVADLQRLAEKLKQTGTPIEVKISLTCFKLDGNLSLLSLNFMATYTIAECPEINVTVRGKDSPTVRQKALDKIIELMDSDELPTELPEGLSAEQLVEIKEQPNNDSDTDEAEEGVIKAVRELNNLASLKIKLQEIYQQLSRLEKI
jgi:hypothetical protein